LSAPVTAVKVLFGSGSEPLIRTALEALRTTRAELPLLVVSEFPPPSGEWIPYHIQRSLRENRELIREKLAGRLIAVSAVILEPHRPYAKLRALGIYFAHGRPLWIDARGKVSMAHYAARRLRAMLTGPLREESRTRRLLRAVRDPGILRLPVLYRMALWRGRWLEISRLVQADRPVSDSTPPAGISVVIPSRDGRELLARCLPPISEASEIIVVDNGSTDGTVAWLRQEHPTVIIEESREPLSFTAAVNRGIRRARFSHLCLLNNDMIVEPGFLRALRACFEKVPGIFSASAQIFFPEGKRREETGKSVMIATPAPAEFPVRFDAPLESEDLSYILYASGGCSLYDTAKLQALGGFDEIYSPAYVEDLDLGVRAWARGWPSVYCAGARVLHAHRATMSRYYTPEQLDLALETNFARFLARTIADRAVFARMWRHNTLRLKALGKAGALAEAARQKAVPVPAGDFRFLDLVAGAVAVFPGRAPAGKPVILVASPYLPFPLSHGAAVRIYNLLREAARDFDIVLVAFVEDPRAAPRELLELCIEVVTVHRAGTHAPPSRGRPDTVEEFDSPAFHAALRQTAAKWRPRIAQLEFTQMAIYREDCGRARTILVEHDITYDLYAQLLARLETNDWQTRRQHDLWVAFETAAWRQVDRVVVMSDKDGLLVEGAVTIPNGVDLERFQPDETPPEPRRLLFIGSFAHRPNVLALEFFLREVFPRLENVTLHVIAGQRHERFWDLKHPGVEIEGFVADVRPAYRKATLVIAPLVASAGTNVKILEAMAMGKAIVSTLAGIHGLDLRDGQDVVVAQTAEQMARAIIHLIASPAERGRLERQARKTVEATYGWNAIGRRQKQLYEDLLRS
jgi:GT2 family glycosyltransferase/glycosyltransferase involved in cell wall biosynthesis